LVEHHFDIGVIVARKRLRTPWADHAWLPHAVLAGVPAAEPGTPLRADGGDELFYAGSLVLTLQSSETAHYRDNLTAQQPSLWVSLRCVGDAYEVLRATANPYEGETMTEGIEAIVEAVPMPAEIQAKVGAFIEAFHVEQLFFKRQRDRADPEALGHRPALASRPVERK
jgi:Protein of unknown function (DUF3305)